MYWDTFVRVTSSDFTTTSSSLVDITGLTFAALANSKYEIESVLSGSSSDANGVKVAISFSAAGSSGSFVTVGGISGGASASGNTVGTAEPTGYWGFAGTTSGIWIKAIVVIGVNAGNITTQVLKVTGGTATIQTGSVMKIKKIV